MEAEQSLWAAVFQLALLDLCASNGPTPRIVQQGAKDWLLSDEKSVGSCAWVCGILGMDDEAVRERVSRLRLQELRARVGIYGETKPTRRGNSGRRRVASSMLLRRSA